MILEVAVLVVKEGTGEGFEAAFAKASGIVSSMPGYLSHELQRCIETPGRYVLLVRWETLEDHTEGFRRSDGYAEWKRLLHHFYDPSPVVEHFEMVHESPGFAPDLCRVSGQARRSPNGTSERPFRAPGVALLAQGDCVSDAPRGASEGL